MTRRAGDRFRPVPANGAPDERRVRAGWRAGALDWVIDALAALPDSTALPPVASATRRAAGNRAEGLAAMVAELLPSSGSECAPIVELVDSEPRLAEFCRRHKVPEYWAFGHPEEAFGSWAARFPEYVFCVGRLGDLVRTHAAYFSVAIGPVAGLRRREAAGWAPFAALLKPAGRFVLYQRPPGISAAWRHLQAELARCGLQTQQRRLAHAETELITGRRLRSHSRR